MLAISTVRAEDVSWPKITSLNIGAVTLRKAGLSLQTGSIVIAAQGDEIRASAAEIEMHDKSGRSVHVPLKAQAVRQADGDLNATLTDSSATISFRFRQEGSRRSLELKPIEFGAGGVDFDSLFPGLVPNISGLGGTVAFLANGDVGGPLAASLTAHDLGFQALGAQMQGFDADWEVTSLWPLTTGSVQRASLDRFDLGEISGRMTMAFVADGRQLTISEAEILAGQNALALSDLAVDLRNGRATGQLFVNGIDLSEFARRFGLDGLDVTGWLAGTVPFEVTGLGQFRLNAGQLSALAPGIIRYRPATPPAALAGSNAGLALARQALENFHYRALQLRLDGDIGGAMTIGMTLEGSNPDLHGGHPLEFNLSLDGALALLAQKAVGAYRLPTALSEKLLDLL